MTSVSGRRETKPKGKGRTRGEERDEIQSDQLTISHDVPIPNLFGLGKQDRIHASHDTRLLGARRSPSASVYANRETTHQSVVFNHIGNDVPQEGAGILKGGLLTMAAQVIDEASGDEDVGGTVAARRGSWSMISACGGAGQRAGRRRRG